MTRYKQELRKHGFKLENDFEYLPCEGIETVKTSIPTDGNSFPGILRSVYHICGGWTHVLIQNDGEMYEFSYTDGIGLGFGNWNG